MNNRGIELIRKDALNIIRFDRIEKKNAITTDMYSAMAEALVEGETNQAVGVHIILGRPGVFTAGNDLKDFMANNVHSAESDDEQPGLGKEVLSFLRNLISAKKPLVAGVDGFAIGIGTTLLMHCDIVYASERSLFQTPFVDLGLVPEAASSLLGPRLLGNQRSFALLALGERWTATEAFEAGLINRVVEQEELEQLTIQTAEILAKKPRNSLLLTKQLLRGTSEELLQRVEEEADHFSQQLASQEAQSAFAKFLNKS